MQALLMTEVDALESGLLLLLRRQLWLSLLPLSRAAGCGRRRWGAAFIVLDGGCWRGPALAGPRLLLLRSSFVSLPWKR